MAGYIRQSSFSDGDTITAALFNNEYNQILNAFSNTSGHAHDGTAAEGPVIGLIGDAGETAPNNKVLIDTTNNYIEFYVQVSSSPVQQLYIADGAIVPVTDSDIDLGTTSLRFKDTYTDTVTTTGNVSVGGNLTVTGTTTFNGGTITMGDAATDNVVFGADVDSNIIPDDDDTYDLGSSSQQWRNLYIDGTANIDSLVADTADINGGTVDGAIIGGSSAAAITGTTITGTSFVIGSADINEAELETIDGVTAGTVAASKAIVVDSNKDFTGARNITLTGELDAGSLDVSGDVDVDGTLETDALSINGTTVTSTAAELNILDGVTASATDINLIDGITNGTVIASKAIVTDSNKDITGGRNITISGELDAATLDISGDADIDGTLEADAITINGVTLAETISDTVGAMVTSNTETGITVAYQDADNTLDFTIGTLNQDTTGTADNITVSANNSTDETVYPIFVDGATGSQGAESDTGLTYNPSSGVLTATQFTGNLTGNVTGNTSGTAATVTGAAQSNITSLGTLTTLTVDNVIINGTTIGHTSDTDLMTLADGVLTVAGEVDAVSLDVSGDIDVDGTTNLDVVDIDGAVNMASTLQVDGSITSSDGATITVNDNSEALSLICTDADASEGPIMSFYRNSGSPADNDILAQLYFQGENDADQKVNYGLIQAAIQDASDGTEDMKLSHKTMVAGTARERMTLLGTETVFNEDSVDLDFRVESNGNANMLFVDGGNDAVGIGTGTIDNNAKLHIEDSAYPVINLDRSSVTGDGQHIGYINFQNNGDIYGRLAVYAEDVSDTDGEIQFQTQKDTTLATKMIIKSDGNVGIGTTSPSANLHVSGSGDKNIAVESTNTGSGANAGIKILSADGGDFLWQTGNATGNALRLYDLNANAERMRITSDGNVGIGVADPTTYNASDKLALYSTGNTSMVIAAGTSSESAIFMADGTSGTASYDGYLQYSHSDREMRIGAEAVTKIKCDSAVTLYYNNGSKFSTNNTGTTTNGLHTATQSANITQVAITSSSNAVAWDARAAANAYHVTTENTTFSAPSNAVEGAIISVEIAQGGTARTVAWNTVFEFAASTAPTVTATANKTDIFSFRYNGSVWQEIGRVQNMAQT